MKLSTISVSSSRPGGGVVGLVLGDCRDEGDLDEGLEPRDGRLPEEGRARRVEEPCLADHELRFLLRSVDDVPQVWSLVSVSRRWFESPSAR